jgi:hypothetical protein
MSESGINRYRSHPVAPLSRNLRDLGHFRIDRRAHPAFTPSVDRIASNPIDGNRIALQRRCINGLRSGSLSGSERTCAFGVLPANCKRLVTIASGKDSPAGFSPCRNYSRRRLAVTVKKKGRTAEPAARELRRIRKSCPIGHVRQRVSEGRSACRIRLAPHNQP